jgi:hypothetical protein
MTHIRQRRDTAANWTSADPILQLGEMGWETDTLRGKLGDGINAWSDLSYAVDSAPVTTVAGKTGDVELDKTDVGLPNVDNTSDAAKPVSAAQAAALALKADLASPTFTGDPKAPSPALADDDTSIATTEWVRDVLANSPVLAGSPTAPTPTAGDNDTSIATTAFVQDAIKSGPWTAYTVAWTASTTDPTIGNGTLQGWYRQVGKTVNFRIRVTFGTTTNVGSGTYFWTLPVNAMSTHIAVAQAFLRNAAGSSRNYRFARTSASGVIALEDAAGAAVTHAVPMAWATGDTIDINGSYETP